MIFVSASGIEKYSDIYRQRSTVAADHQECDAEEVAKHYGCHPSLGTQAEMYLIPVALGKDCVSGRCRSSY